MVYVQIFMYIMQLQRNATELFEKLMLFLILYPIYFEGFPLMPTKKK